MEFVSQTDQGQMDAPLRFEIPVVETLHEHESNEEGEDEIKDGRGVMLETVIERPISHQGVEQIVFDLPASMSDVPEHSRRAFGTWRASSPTTSDGPRSLRSIGGFCDVVWSPFPPYGELAEEPQCLLPW